MWWEDTAVGNSNLHGLAWDNYLVRIRDIRHLFCVTPFIDWLLWNMPYDVFSNAPRMWFSKRLCQLNDRSRSRALLENFHVTFVYLELRKFQERWPLKDLPTSSVGILANKNMFCSYPELRVKCLEQCVAVLTSAGNVQHMRQVFGVVLSLLTWKRQDKQL